MTNIQFTLFTKVLITSNHFPSIAGSEGFQLFDFLWPLIDHFGNLSKQEIKFQDMVAQYDKYLTNACDCAIIFIL